MVLGNNANWLEMKRRSRLSPARGGQAVGVLTLQHVPLSLLGEDDGKEAVRAADQPRDVGPAHLLLLHPLLHGLVQAPRQRLEEHLQVELLVTVGEEAGEGASAQPDLLGDGLMDTVLTGVVSDLTAKHVLLEDEGETDGALL